MKLTGVSSFKSLENSNKKSVSKGIMTVTFILNKRKAPNKNGSTGYRMTTNLTRHKKTK